MKIWARLIFAAALVAALTATYRVLQEEEQAVSHVREASGKNPILDRIRNLPETPAEWKLLETAPEEINMDALPDIQPAIIDLIESANRRVTFESYFLKKSLGKAAKQLLEAPAEGIRVLGVLHPNPMSDAPFLDELRAAGAQIIERDLAPLGGNPEDGYLHSKFVVVDGRRGYLGSANLGAAGMKENREMGIYFDDAHVAHALELMAGYDAGHLNSPAAVDIPSAVLLQGAPEGFEMKGMPLCEEGAAALFEMAKQEIDIMMFAFSHQFGKYDAIAGPLRAAVRRGVKVRLLHDARTLRELEGVTPTLRDMKQWGVDVRTADFSSLGKSRAGQYHAKAMRVDEEFLMVGSNNWTDAGSHENREVALILRSRDLTRKFVERFNADWNSPGYVKPFLK